MHLKPPQHIHFIGIGGVSMSALAEALYAQGFVVTGSDTSDSERVQRLRAAGIPVYQGQAAGNIDQADVIVYTTAIRDDNPELLAARASGQPVMHRSELLARLLADKQRIAVTGTHGKSTTTAMLGTIFLELGCDPTVFVGGYCANLGANYRQGQGGWAIFEACESDASFLKYENCSQVLTSIEPDHLDEHNDFASLCQVFADFVSRADPDGFVVYCADDPQVVEMIQYSPAPVISYGMTPEAQVTAQQVVPCGDAVSFVPIIAGQALAPVTLPLVGQHNVLNALAALAVAGQAGLDEAGAVAALERFAGVGRRFEEIGRVNGYRVIDDYAHHPTEIRATLQAAKDHFASRVVAVFQPHLYSRTRYLMDEFATAFENADVVVITDIYGAREPPTDEVSAEELYERVRANEPDKLVRYIPTADEIVDFLHETAQPQDIVITIGAGDIRQVAELLVETAQQSQDK